MKSLKIVAALALVVCAVPQLASAVPVTFTIDPVQSNLQINLVAYLGGSPLPSLGQGSVIPASNGKLANGNPTDGSVTSYQGTIKTDLNFSQITFTGGSSVQALNSDNGGGWAPIDGGGPQSSFPQYLTTPALRASANYGWALAGTVVLADLRNFVLDPVSGSLALGGGGSFASTQTLNVLSGLTNYADTIGGVFISTPGSTNLTGAALGNGAGNGSVVFGPANLITLTAPVKVVQQLNISGTPVDLVVSGTLVATANAVIPEPSTMILSGIGLAMVTGFGFLRRKKS
ncbi:MAG: PEP-CTERM sorting domain-containing protein [Pirellulales bacterium]|nr:PEP-CTERM sorting domain-containing protein [Pirellulales bacterium]